MLKERTRNAYEANTELITETITERRWRFVGRGGKWASAAALMVCLSAAPANAQQSIRDILSFLLTNQAIPTEDFEGDRLATDATRDTISRALLIELATLPLTSSSGGFTYRLNPSLGTLERASESFGPVFLERALTSGRNQFAFGLSARYARFESLDGQNLRDGTFIATANKFRDEAVPFDVETLTLEIEATTFTLFGTVGVTDRFDIGGAIPLVMLKLDGQRINTNRGRTLLQARASASITGLADVALRAKYQVVKTRAGGLSAAADIRLPTGREESLLGAGTAAAKVLVIGSVEGSRASSHVNVGYTFGGVTHEINYGGGVTLAPAPRVTLIFEVLGRQLDELHRFSRVSANHPRIAGVETIRVLPQGDATRTAFGVAGLKWNLSSTWLLTTNVLVSLTDTGLKAPVMPGISLEYGFNR